MKNIYICSAHEELSFKAGENAPLYGLLLPYLAEQNIAKEAEISGPELDSFEEFVKEILDVKTAALPAELVGDPSKLDIKNLEHRLVYELISLFNKIRLEQSKNGTVYVYDLEEIDNANGYILMTARMQQKSVDAQGFYTLFRQRYPGNDITFPEFAGRIEKLVQVNFLAREDSGQGMQYTATPKTKKIYHRQRV